MKMADVDAPALRPFIPKIISRGGGCGITLSLLREENFDRQALDYFSSTTFVLSDSTVYDPMPLRCYNPQAGEKRKRRGSIEEFPKLLQAIESHGGAGSTPVLLYSKKLEGSDVREDLNRLFLTKRSGAALRGYLNAAEAAAVDESARGLRIVGLDAGGNSYNLGLKKWPSLNMMVINSDWNKLVASNNAEKGDCIRIWGFRRNHGLLGLAIVFS